MNEIVEQLRISGYNVVIQNIPIGITRSQIEDTFQPIGLTDTKMFITGETVKTKIFGLKINQANVEELVNKLQNKVFRIAGRNYPIDIIGFDKDKRQIVIYPIIKYNHILVIRYFILALIVILYLVIFFQTYR